MIEAFFLAFDSVTVALCNVSVAINFDMPHTFGDGVFLHLVNKAVMERLFSKAVFDIISISPTVGVLSISAEHA